MAAEFLPFLPGAIGLLALSLLPMFVVMATSFTKISIVLFLLRNALGVQQAPSGMVLNAIALTLTLFICAPIGHEIAAKLQAAEARFSDMESALKSYKIISDGFVSHMKKFTTDREAEFFVQAAESLWPAEMKRYISKDNLIILLPAHTTSEITRAFEIAFLLFLPFVVVDMVVSNILLAMGAMMVPPMLISLPVKLLLFVAADGWSRLLHALIMSYA